MDLKTYFQKIRDTEAAIEGEHAVVVSLETPDGGREGRLSEVSRALAAKLIVQGKARQASDEEAEEFRSAVREAKRVADEQSRQRAQLGFLKDADAQLLQSMLRGDE